MRRRSKILLWSTGALLLLPAAALYWLMTSSSGLHWALNRLKAALPGELQVMQVEGSLIGPIRLEGVNYHDSSTRLALEKADLDWNPAALSGGRFHLRHLRLTGLKVALPASTGKSDKAFEMPVLPLPPQLRLDEIRIDGLTVTAANHAPVTAQQVILRAAADRHGLEIKALELEAAPLSFSAHGTLNPKDETPLQLETQWRWQPNDGPQYAASGRLRGSLSQLRLRQHLSAPLTATLDALLTPPFDRPHWQATLRVPELDTAALDPGWQPLHGALTLEGEGDLTQQQGHATFKGRHDKWGPFDAELDLQRDADGRLQVPQLRLHSEGRIDDLRGSGRWNPATDIIELNLAWKEIQWPQSPRPLPISRNGALDLYGSHETYTLGIATDLAADGLPPAHLRVGGQGDSKHFDARHLQLDTLGGRINGNGHLSWETAFQWQAQLTGQDLDPGRQWPRWPGDLKFRIKGSGGVNEKRVTTRIDIRHVDGTLRGYPLALTAALAGHDNEWQVDKLQLRSGDARLQAQGHIGETLALQLQLDAADLAQLHPDAGGELHSRLSLNGPRRLPQLSVELDGNKLAWRETRLSRLRSRIALDPGPSQQLRMDVAASGLHTPRLDIDSLKLNGDGDHNGHTLTLALRNQEADAVVTLSGRYAGQHWDGHLDRADINSRGHGSWKLTAPASLQLAADRQALDTACWQAGEGRLCLEGARDGQGWRASINGRTLSLKQLSPLMPDGLALIGTGDIQLEATRRSDQPPTTRLQIDLMPGELTYPLIEGERGHWAYGKGELKAQLDSSGFSGSAALGLGHTGDQFNATLNMPGWQGPQDEQAPPLEGDIRIEVSDLGPLEALYPEYVQQLRGRIAILVDVAGTLNQPLINGKGVLRDGSMRVPRLGLTLTNMQLEVTNSGSEQLDYSLSARSGRGQAKLTGTTRLDRQAQWPTQLRVTGRDFEVSRIPEARVEISPDLTLHNEGRDIYIGGKIEVPYARLQPKDLSRATTVSDDVVIIGEAQPKERQWRVHSEVRLILGERVSFSGFGFDGRIGGDLLLVDIPGTPTHGRGELFVREGRYRAYGQRLEVEQGRILFTDSPLTNPGLDIRAVRKVDEVTAGLRVRGTVKVPQVELFSTPAMGQTDTLAYIIVGHPLDESSQGEGALLAQAALALGLRGGDSLARNLSDRFGLEEMRIETSESGEAAWLVVGRYLSPRIYVSYGVALMQSVNIFSVRYRISSHWQLKGEAGEQQGGDLVYTIER